LAAEPRSPIVGRRFKGPPARPENTMRIVAALIFAIALSTGGTAVAVEEPPYTSILRDGAFEIRAYPDLTVAEVTVPGEQNEAASRGFRILAGYIFGGNRGHRSIAMTAPVTLEARGETIAMTAPVTRTRHEGAWVVRFTMPHSYSLATLPVPNDPRIRLSTTAPTRFAVLRFSGLVPPSAVERETAELLRLMKAHRLTPIGPVTLAQYDPPWTLWFLRRNEVMAPVAP
jgi:hypothetical protein